MTENYHAPWEDGVTAFRASHMNVPLGELDEAIGNLASDVTQLETDMPGKAPLEHTHDPTEITSSPIVPCGSLAGKPQEAGQTLMRVPLPFDTVFPSGLTGSYCKSAVAAAAQADIDITKNDVSIGTIRFAAAATTATFIFASAVEFDAGDVLGLTAPDPQDATLEDIGWALVGSRAVVVPAPPAPPVTSTTV